MYGVEFGNAMRCENENKGKWTEEFIWDLRGYEEMGGGLWLTYDKYMKYVHNYPEKPWLLMFVKSPHGSTESHF